MALSCVYPYDDALDYKGEPVLAFEGRVVIGGYSSLAVRYMQRFDGSYPDDKRVPEVSWWQVENEDGSVVIKPSSPDGEADTRSLDPEKKYRIVANVDGRQYESLFEKALVPPELKNISFSAGKESVNVFVDIDAGPDNTGYVVLQIEEIWEFHALFVQEMDIFPDIWEYYVVPPDTQNYWCWKQQKSVGLYLVDLTMLDGSATTYPFYSFLRTNERNQRNYYLRVRARTLKSDEYRYLHNLSLAGDAMGNLFVPNPGEIEGNVVNPDNAQETVLGRVSVERTSYRDAYLSAMYLTTVDPPGDDFFLNVHPDWFEAFYYDYDYRPVRWIFMEDGSQLVGWAHRSCVDCTLSGTLEKPEFSY